MRSISRLFPRQGYGKITQEDLDRLAITVAKQTILSAAEQTRVELNKELGSDAASVALAVALGKLCAESGLKLEDALALVELTHRACLSDTEISDGSAVAA